jgi:hypothetical protein
VAEFIRTCVSDRPDLYVVPGGPAGLSTWSSSFTEADAAERSFRFLAEKHQLTSVWLIAHADCAYYRSKYHPHEDEFIVRQQLQDMKRATEAIRRWYSTIAVHQIYARLDDTQVLFEAVASSSSREPRSYDETGYG